LNLAISKAKGKDIVSGQSLFGADELAYIAEHFIYVKSYLLRDGSGVGVGAPQYGERRTWFAAMTKGF
jgi:hypothetical protein